MSCVPIGEVNLNLCPHALHYGGATQARSPLNLGPTACLRRLLEDLEKCLHIIFWPHLGQPDVESSGSLRGKVRQGHHCRWLSSFHVPVQVQLLPSRLLLGSLEGATRSNFAVFVFLFLWPVRHLRMSTAAQTSRTNQPHKPADVLYITHAWGLGQIMSYQKNLKLLLNNNSIFMGGENVFLKDL